MVIRDADNIRLRGTVDNQPVTHRPATGTATTTGPLAQWSEQAAYNRFVAGSNPTGVTSYCGFIVFRTLSKKKPPQEKEAGSKYCSLIPAYGHPLHRQTEQEYLCNGT